MDYVIVGAGPAGVIAAETVRGIDSTGSITLLGDESEPPYSRMAIPYLLAGNIGEEGTCLRHGRGHYDDLNIDVRRERVASVSPDTKTVALAGGGTLSYDRLLIATGSRAVRPPIPGIDLPGCETCWTMDDARAIARRATPGSRVVLMGAGFIGCIVLEALAARDVKLTVIEMAERMLPRMMDEVGSDIIRRWCEDKGVTVVTAAEATSIEAANGALRFSLGDGSSIDADLVVCATGVAPNTEMLNGCGVETDAGVLVDAYLETSAPGVHAAGDVAQGPDFSTGRQEVHAIQPTASDHGRIAGLNMAGQRVRYQGSLSMNVLNTLGLVSSSFGLWMGVDGGERAVAVDAKGYKYLRLEFDDDVVVGGLGLGLIRHVGVIRGLIQSRVRLGPWKDRLMRDPHLINHAYLECTRPK